MRKSFTRFFGLLLILLISLSSYAAPTYKPVTGGGGATTNLKLTQELSVTFDGVVTASATKYVRLYDDNGTPGVGDDVPLFVQPATDPAIIVQQSKVTFNFNQYLAENKSYYIAYDAGAFSVAGVAQPAVNQATWTFAIGDWTAPRLATVTPLTPADGSTNVDATVNFVVKFNENVNLGVPVSGNGSGFYLMKDNGTGYGDIVEVIAAGNITGAGTTTLTINPVATMAEKSNYYILIENGAVVDASANANKFAGFVDEGKLFAAKTWGVSTKDMTAPAVTVTFVSATTTSVTVAVKSDDAGFVWVDYVNDGAGAPGSITTTGKKLTFTAAGTQEVTFSTMLGTPTDEATLANSLNRDIWVGSQTNINVAGVAETPANAAAVDPLATKKLDVTLIDGRNPVVVGAFDPANTSTGIAKNKKLALTFNEAVKIGTGNVVIKKTVDNSTWKTYSIADIGKTVAVGGVNKKVELTLPDNFASLGQYYVLIDEGAIVDNIGNKYAGIPAAVPQSWSFTVVDYEAPTYTVVPANGASVNAAAPSAVTAITLTFNENIRHSSGNALVNGASVNANGLQEAFELYEDGTKINHTYTFDLVGLKTITVVPQATGALQRQKTYRLVFYAYWLEDALGNEIRTPADITFTTKDQIAPSISAWGPATVDVSSNLTITFTEAIRMADDSEITNANVANLIILRKWNSATASFSTVGSADYTVAIDAAKKVITVDPVAEFPSGGQYRLTVSPNVEDLAGNALTNVTQLAAPFGSATSGTDREKDYTVKDYVAPVITLTPANGAAVASTTTIVVSASEAVTLLTGAAPDNTMITLREGGINGTDVVLPLPGVAGNVYTFTPAPALTAGKTYYLAVDATLKDASGNVNTKVTSTFTTLGNTPPNAIAGKTYSPAAASTLNAKNAVITVTFPEAVKLVAGWNTAATVSVDGGADLNTTAATLSADGKVLTIPHADFTASVAGVPVTNNVVVTIPVGMLTAGDNTAMTAPIAWAFGSHDATAPVPTYAPALAGTPAGVAIDVTPKINFNEEIKILPTAYVEIRDVATDYLVQTITGSKLSLKSVGGTNNELNITLLGNLVYGKSYYIFIPPNVITDKTGNPYAGVVNKPSDGVNVAWNFDVVANPGALIVNTTKSVPALFTDNVAVGADLTVEFSNQLNSTTVDATKNWVLYELTGFNTTTATVAGFAGVADQYSSLDPSMSVSGNKIIVNPTFNLKANTWYILRFANGFIKDTYGTLLTGSSANTGGAAGNMDYVGINSNDIVFHTGSAQGPIASIQPADKQENVAKNSNIVITFNEPFFKAGGVAPITVADLEAWPSSYITVSSNNTGAIAYNASISGNTIVIDPVADFNVLDNERVTVTVLAGRFYDANNNTYDATMGSGAVGSPADDQVFYFDPIDQTGPIASVSAGFPTSTKGTELTYKVESNELGYVYSLVLPTAAPAPSAAKIKAEGTVTEIKATATPSAAIVATGLTIGTSYTVYVVGIDAVAVPNTGAVASAAVTTPDDVAPIFVKALPVSPVTTATPTISFEFNENLVAAASGLVIVREKATQDIVAGWDITALAGTSDVGVTAAKKVTLNLGVANGAFVGSVAAFTSEVVYEVRLDPQSVQDASGNKNAEPIVHEFTIKDLANPTITATSPAVSAVGAAPTHTGQNLSITFSENMTSTATVIRVYENRGAGFAGSIIPNNEIETIDPNTVTWNADKTKATFSISHFLLKAVTEYYIVVADACFKDDGNNNPNWAAYLAGNVFQFKTPDQTTLVATHTFTPAPLVANTNVNPTAVITINFGEDVVWTKHPFKQYIVSANADSILSIYDANNVKLTSAKVTLNAIDTDASSGMDRFTITPVTKLDDNSTYTVKFNDIEDINGNDVLDHVAAGTQFTFTTGDGTAPKITFDPIKNKTEVSENGPFVMTFDEPLYALTGVVGAAAQVIDNNLVGNYVDLIYGAGLGALTGTKIPHTATISADYKTITLTPTAAIQQPNVAATKVRYGFKTAVAVGDYNGNQINAGATQTLDAATVTAANATTFVEVTIRDYKAPKVIAVGGYAPTGAAAINAAMTVRFDEDIAKGSGNLYIRELLTGNIIETVAASAVTVTLNHATMGDHITVPHKAFPVGTQFYVTIDEGFVTDVSASKNKFAGISDTNATIGKTWTFNTADINGPVAIDMTPKNNAVEVLLEEKLKLFFDQPVQAGAGNIVIYEADGTPFDIIPVPSANVDFNAQYAAGGGDTIVTISHLKFKDASTYFVRIDKGAIDDKSGNDYVGISDRSWTFTTEDYTPATYTIVSPLDDATVVGLNPTFELNFNRAIQAGNGKIQLWKRAGDVKLQEINASNATISADGKTASFTFPTILPEATDLYIIINPNAFVNASVSRVPFVGITEQWTWNFTTGTDATAPTKVSVSPDVASGNGEKLKPADVKLVLTLNEDVKAKNGKVIVYNAADDKVAFETTVTDAMISGAVVTVVPTGLAEQKSYYVNVEGTALTDKAVTPNAFTGIAGKTAWTFTTGDFTAPKMVTVSPKATTLADNHPAELVLTLDENVTLTATGGNVKICKVGTTTATVTIPLTAAMINGKVITITYDAKVVGGLDKNTDYYVLVDANALKDNAGNAFAGIADAAAWTFKTGANFKTGIEDDVNVSFKVYPNPFVNELKVDNASELSRIVITSMTGQKVKEIVNPTSTIQTSELRSGVYFISLYVDDVVAKTERIVKR